MKDHGKFYGLLRVMAVLNVAVGGLLLIILIYSLIASEGSILQDSQMPTSFYTYPLQNVILFVLGIMYSLLGIRFGICDFISKLKAVGILAVAKALCIVGWIVAFCGKSIIYNLTDGLVLVTFAVAAGYFVCGIYASKCLKEEKSPN